MQPGRRADPARSNALRAAPRAAQTTLQLAAAVNGVKFPYWEDRFGWRSTGIA